MEQVCVECAIDHETGEGFGSIERAIAAQAGCEFQIKSSGFQAFGECLPMLRGGDYNRHVASHDRIFVLRKRPSLRRIRFTFDMLSQNEPRAATFLLQAGDVVVVE